MHVQLLQRDKAGLVRHRDTWMANQPGMRY